MSMVWAQDYWFWQVSKIKCPPNASDWREGNLHCFSRRTETLEKLGPMKTFKKKKYAQVSNFGGLCDGQTVPCSTRQIYVDLQHQSNNQKRHFISHILLFCRKSRAKVTWAWSEPKTIDSDKFLKSNARQMPLIGGKDTCIALRRTETLEKLGPMKKSRGFNRKPRLFQKKHVYAP